MGYAIPSNLIPPRRDTVSPDPTDQILPESAPDDYVTRPDLPGMPETIGITLAMTETGPGKLTPEELRCLTLSRELSNTLDKLPSLHPFDAEDFGRIFRELQNLIWSRPAIRANPEHVYWVDVS